MKLFSIVIPIYQNELNIENTLNQLLTLKLEIKDLNVDTEFVFVDDGSTDKSYNLLEDYKFSIDNFKLVKLAKNYGQQNAILAGIKVASGDCIGIISADLQDPLFLFKEMLTHWLSGKKLIVAEREERDESWFHQNTSAMYWNIIRKFGIKDFPKGGFDFCLFDSEIADIVNSNHEKNTSFFPLLFLYGYNYKIIKYKRNLRELGESTWTLSKKIKLTIDTIIGFTKLPIRLITYLGIATSTLAIILLFIFLFVRLFTNVDLPLGWSSTITIFLFFIGMVLFSLGILSEYLSRVLDEVRKRPNYIIEKIDNSETKLNV